MPGYGNYDRYPQVRLDGEHPLWRGEQVWDRLVEVAREQSLAVAVDCYPGVDVAAVRDALAARGRDVTVVDVEERAGLGAAELATLLADDLTDDRVFGVLRRRPVEHFFDAEELDRLREELATVTGPTLVVGWGASLVVPSGSPLVLADLPRWEIQQRYRAGMGNWRAGNDEEDVLRKYKRGFFVEWRSADEHKRGLLGRCDLLLDTTTTAKLIEGATFRAGLARAAAQPFRLVPFFDPGPWGGTWMEQVCGLEPLEGQQYAWCFDCVPEENSLRLGIGEDFVEVPSLDLVLQHPEQLLGTLTHARFGAEFPIRFDFLDTMGGGNLSLQVHPTTDYIQRHFSMPYTQDESYYLLDAEPGAQVYLGLRDGVGHDELEAALRAGQQGEEVPADTLVNTFPAQAHDHFLIPAGTVHCSGAGSMVLEVSATPFIFTFKLWDWGRLGLDGRPRPIHLEHGMANVDFRRGTEWARTTAVNAVEQVAGGEGWVEERTGLHELEFIETRRHSFTEPVEHHTRGTVHVLNLVEGEAAVVESPSGAFEPFPVHYAETFVVPAAVGAYRVRGTGQGPWRTLRANVRGTELA